MPMSEKSVWLSRNLPERGGGASYLLKLSLRREHHVLGEMGGDGASRVGPEMVELSLGRLILSTRMPVPPRVSLPRFTWKRHEGGTLATSSWPGQCLLGVLNTCLLGVLRCGRDRQTALHGFRPQLWAGSLFQV